MTLAERLRAAAGDPTNPSDRRVPGPGLSSWCREQVALLDELGDDPRAWPAAPRTLLPPALLAADGNLAEGPGFNIWVVKDGKCATPDSNCLLGMSRQSVIELCGMEGIPFELRAVHPDELRGADEAFTSTTAGGITPVTQVDGKTLGNGAPGILTSRLSEEYWRRREAGWHGPRGADVLAARDVA